MWYEINSQRELINFLEKMCYFHDSCIKEMKYYSGAYVNDNLSMHPINDKRVLCIVVQRQFENNSMIEIEFSGLKFLKLFPECEKYTCEILESTMILKKDCVYWCDSGGLSESDLDNYNGTMICANKFRWRCIDDCMGKKEFYKSVI